MWHEVDFTLSDAGEAHLFGSLGRSAVQFRKTLAALDTKYRLELGPDFFGYGQDGDTKDLGDTTTGMGTTKNGLRIVAIGNYACEHLRGKAAAIQGALIRETGTMVRCFERSGEHTADFFPVARRMFIKRLCVGRSAPDSFWIRAAHAVQAGSTWLEEADRMIPNYIGRGLMRQAVLLITQGDDLEGNVANLIYRANSMSSDPIEGPKAWKKTGTDFGTRLGIKLMGVGGHSYIKIAGKRTAVLLENVEFTIKANFTGPWFVGRLKVEAAGQMMESSEPITGTSQAWQSVDRIQGVLS